MMTNEEAHRQSLNKIWSVVFRSVLMMIRVGEGNIDTAIDCALLAAALMGMIGIEMDELFGGGGGGGTELERRPFLLEESPLAGTVMVLL
jgi:hypothetical protein